MLYCSLAKKNVVFLCLFFLTYACSYRLYFSQNIFMTLISLDGNSWNKWYIYIFYFSKLKDFHFYLIIVFTVTLCENTRYIIVILKIIIHVFFMFILLLSSLENCFVIFLVFLISKFDFFYGRCFRSNFFQYCRIYLIHTVKSRNVSGSSKTV